MKPIPDQLLLTTAQIAATLIGLLLVGVFFYLETGFRRTTEVARPFLRATTKLIVLLYSLVLGLSLGLVALELLWVRVLFALLSLAIVAALVEWTLRSRDLSPDLKRAVRVQPWLGWPIVLIPLALPWALEGWDPGREVLTVTLFLAGVLAFMNTASLLLLAFDLAAIERVARVGNGEPARKRGHIGSRRVRSFQQP